MTDYEKQARAEKLDNSDTVQFFDEFLNKKCVGPV